jgi:predicted outer membrane protein
MTKLTPVAATVLILLAGCGKRDSDTGNRIEVTGQATQPQAGPAPAEVHGQPFISTVLGSLDFSIAGAKQVAGRGETGGGKALATRMDTELSAARQALVAIAKTGGLKLEPQAGPTFQTDLAILSSGRGKPLEQAFAQQQVDSLTLLVGTVRAYKNGGDNPALKAWAEKYQGVINDRLLDMQTLQAELEGNS